MVNKTLIYLLSLVVFLAGMSLASMRAQATDYDFTLTNASSGYVITGFYTQENGKWSRNWLSGRIRAGQSVTMHWGSNDGACSVPFRVSWEGHPDETFNMDWCARTVRELLMKDSGFSVR